MSAGIAEIDAGDVGGPDEFQRQVVEGCRPVLIRDLVGAWPVVHAARRSARDFQAYLTCFDSGRQAEAFIGEARIAGQYYYNDDLQGFNFERKRMSFAAALHDIIATHDQPGTPTLYLGSLPVDDYLPGFAARNEMRVLGPHIAARIWLGHAANVAPHFDTFDNLACVIAGLRRFTLYPPEAIARLYVGPLDHTMAGQPVSLAAAGPPDDEKYPLFREIREQALIAELKPGDALYLPKLWWHKVESTAAFNGLINYWWDAFSLGPDAPYNSLLLSMITIAERPLAERLAWKAFFDHYVFRSAGHPLAHLPVERHGVLGPLKPDNYGRLRAHVMRSLRGQ